MKMLSVLQRMVENEGRMVIRAGEWFLWMRDDFQKPKAWATPSEVKALRVIHPPALLRGIVS